jgi:hypothetical protein
MLPEFARDIILQFSHAMDIVIDPFMGGGTTIIEALATGRQAIGIDLNSLAVFVATVKTTPLSPLDEQCINNWVLDLDFSEDHIRNQIPEDDPRMRNLSIQTRQTFSHLLEQVSPLPYKRQQRFARCCLLRLGQWAVDGKDALPNAGLMKEKLIFYVHEMLAGLNDLVAFARYNGISKNKLVNHRVLLHRSAVDADKDESLRSILGKPSLVVTSPPYPGVHVLYHRWQIEGRRETPAPYWFIGANDGYGASYYTCGSRSQLGLDIYFRTIKETFQSLRSIIHPEALVIQLVSFCNVSSQLPAYLQAMKQAGYEEIFPFNTNRTDLWRTVPNRKWYNYIGASHGTGKELMLFHRPCANTLVS